MKRLILAWGAALGLAAAARGADDFICFEAEDADEVTAPVRLICATNAAAGEAAGAVLEAAEKAFLEIPQGAGNPPVVTGGEAVYSFEVAEDGGYILWCRTWWSDECGNSLTIRLDETAPFSFGQDSTFKCWHWVKSPSRLKQLTLKKGRHTLRIANREDGVRFDQILLTRNARYVPVDREKSRPRAGGAR